MEKIIFKILDLKLKKYDNLELIVEGISMLPDIKNGDTVIVEKSDSYNEDDIIVFNYNKEGLLIHRIISIKNNVFICKGDNSSRLERVKVNDILGKINNINKKIVK